MPADPRDVPCEQRLPPTAATLASCGPPADPTLTELTAAQCRAVDAAAGRPVALVDPRSGASHILLTAEEHARLMKAAEALTEVRLEAEWLERTHGRAC